MITDETLVARRPPLSLAEGGNVLRVGNTRVPLDSVILSYDQGATPEEIVSAFPSLDLADVYAVIAYYLHNQQEVTQYLAERRQRASEVREQVEGRSPTGPLRERLRAQGIRHPE